MQARAKAEWAGFAIPDLNSPEEFTRSDAQDRYRRFRNAATREELSIKDEFCRGLAIHQVIKLCVRAGDINPGGALLVLVDDKDIRERMLDQFPDLKA